MTDTQLTWIGIVSQAIPTITAILMVTVGNWMIKMKDKNKFRKHTLFQFTIEYKNDSDFSEYYSIWNNSIPRKP